MRLTKKYDDGSYCSKNLVERPHNPLYPITPSELDKQWDLERTKLGQLEDIEEELGIDLITLFKALKNGIWVKYDSDFGITGKPKIKIVKDKATGLCYRDKKWYIQEEETLLKDYGKTWALTKEELL